MHIKVDINRIGAERRITRSNDIRGEISIKNNLTIKETLGEPSEGEIVQRFTVSSDYNPDIGKVTFSGEAHILGDEEELRSIVEEEDEKHLLVKREIIIKQMIEGAKTTQTLGIPSMLNIPSVDSLKTSKNDDERETRYHG